MHGSSQGFSPEAFITSLAFSYAIAFTVNYFPVSPLVKMLFAGKVQPACTHIRTKLAEAGEWTNELEALTKMPSRLPSAGGHFLSI